MRRGGAGLGWQAHRVDPVACPEARSGPTLASMVLVPLLSEIHDFRDRVLFCYRGVPPPHLFPIYAQHVETNTYTKKNR